jgi:hypothetical protein
MTSFFRRSVPLLVLGALLAGCASAAQIAQRNEERCTERGYQPKTDAFSDCVLRLEGERRQRMEDRRREMLEKPTVPPN